MYIYLDKLEAGMAKFSTEYRTDNQKTKDKMAARDATQTTRATTKNAAQSTYASARDAAQHTYGNVQEKLHTGVDKASTTLSAILNLAGMLLRRKQKQAEKATSKKARGPFSNFQKAIQNRINTGFEKASDTWTSGAEDVQSQFRKGAKEAQKNLAKTQRGFSSAFDKANDDLIHLGDKRARKSPSRATTAEGMRTSVQNGGAGRTIFRVGLLTGVLLALLYTPIAGSDVRKQIAKKWDEYRTYLGLA
jgi:hypothetical protein